MNFVELPYDVVEQVFMFLELGELRSLACTCRALRGVLKGQGSYLVAHWKKHLSNYTYVPPLGDRLAVTFYSKTDGHKTFTMTAQAYVVANEGFRCFVESVTYANPAGGSMSLTRNELEGSESDCSQGCNWVISQCSHPSCADVVPPRYPLFHFHNPGGTFSFNIKECCLRNVFYVVPPAWKEPLVIPSLPLTRIKYRDGEGNEPVVVFGDWWQGFVATCSIKKLRPGTDQLYSVSISDVRSSKHGSTCSSKHDSTCSSKHGSTCSSKHNSTSTST